VVDKCGLGEPRDNGDGMDGEGIGLGADLESFGDNPPCERGEELKGMFSRIPVLGNGREEGLGPLKDGTDRERPSCIGGLGNASGARGGVKLVTVDGFDIVRNEGRTPLEIGAELEAKESLRWLLSWENEDDDLPGRGAYYVLRIRSVNKNAKHT
jgi:hypothetical protein